MRASSRVRRAGSRLFQADRFQVRRGFIHEAGINPRHRSNPGRTRRLRPVFTSIVQRQKRRRSCLNLGLVWGAPYGLNDPGGAGGLSQPMNRDGLGTASWCRGNTMASWPYLAEGRDATLTGDYWRSGILRSQNATMAPSDTSFPSAPSGVRVSNPALGGLRSLLALPRSDRRSCVRDRGGPSRLRVPL
jgi:hypothetical protein